MSARDFDVAIVGASVAGCTAATLLGRQGARVALVESHEDPRAYKRICTHALAASAAPTLERLGLLDAVAAAGRRAELNAWTRYGWVSPSRAFTKRLPSPDYYGFNLRRESFDPMLRELAAGTPGVELLLGHAATGLVRDGGRIGGVSVESRDGSAFDLRARLVVGADGRRSRIAAQGGGRLRSSPNNRFAYFAYYRDTPLVTGSSPQAWFLDPDMAYAFPTDDGLTLLCCLPHKDRLEEFKADPEAAMSRLYESVPDGPRLDPAKRQSKVLGKLDFPNERRSPSRPGLALVGDAALASDPLWGVGCGWALQSSEWLVEAAGPALGSEAELDRALKAYSRRHRKALAMHHRVSSEFSKARRFNPLERLFMRAAARDDELAGSVALFAERWVKPQQLATPGNLGRIVRANLRGRETGLRPVTARQTGKS